MTKFERQVLKNQTTIFQALKTIISYSLILPEFNRTGNIRKMRESPEYQMEELMLKRIDETLKLLSAEDDDV